MLVVAAEPSVLVLNVGRVMPRRTAFGSALEMVCYGFKSILVLFFLGQSPATAFNILGEIKDKGKFDEIVHLLVLDLASFACWAGRKSFQIEDNHLRRFVNGKSS